MLRVQRNKQRQNWVTEGKKAGVSPSYWSELKVRRDATHAGARTHSHSQSHIQAEELKG